MKKLFLTLALFACHMVNAEEVKYNEKNQLIELSALTEVYSECSNERFIGRITKIEGRYPSQDIWFKSIDGKITSAVPLELDQLSMATIRSLDTLFYKGSLVHVYIQRCGSGNIPYLISVRSAKNTAVKK